MKEIQANVEGESPILDSRAEPLLASIAVSNRGNFSVLARQLLHRWSKALDAETFVEPSEGQHVQFKTLLSGLYLRGFEEMECILVPPFARLESHLMMQELYRGHWGTPRIVLVLADEHRVTLRNSSSGGRWVVLSRDALAHVLAGNPNTCREALRQVIRRQLSLKTLHPYQTMRPVAGEMFFGRRRELALLFEQENDWFVVTGPSKVGKSSLLHQYRWMLRKSRSPRLTSSFLINLQPCSNRSEDEVARFFATNFRDVPYTSQELKFRELRSFLYNVVASLGGPIEIILDEADAVCHTDLLITVAEFTSSSQGRLLVAGRSALRRFWRKHQATSFGRLRDLRFHALEPEEAWQLFVQPIEALGLRIESPEVLRETVLRQTSRMPHLIQGCARSIIELAGDINSACVTPSMLHRGQDSFFDFSLLRSHLEDLQSDRARVAAIEVLENVRSGIHSIERIQGALKRYGMHLRIGEITDICDDLVINCLLTWEHSKYGPPRWDICETAQRHFSFLAAYREECIERIKLTEE